MPLTVYFIRHGQSKANVDHVFANRVDFASNLTAEGIAQAHAHARAFANAGITQVYTSPLPRARRSASILAMDLGISLTVTDALREYDVGDYEGLPYAGEESWRMERYDEVEQSWRKGDRDARHPGGENLDDLLQRFRPFMSYLVSRHSSQDSLVAVGHGGLYRAVLPFLFHSIDPQFAADHPLAHNGAIVGEYRAGAWQCVFWGDESVDLPG